MNHVRRETSRHFRNKKREYLKGKIDELNIANIVTCQTLGEMSNPSRAGAVCNIQNG
jgi:ribosomal protein L32